MCLLPCSTPRFCEIPVIRTESTFLFFYNKSVIVQKVFVTSRALEMQTTIWRQFVYPINTILRSRCCMHAILRGEKNRTKLEQTRVPSGCCAEILNLDKDIYLLREISSERIKDQTSNVTNPFTACISSPQSCVC